MERASSGWGVDVVFLGGEGCFFGLESPIGSHRGSFSNSPNLCVLLLFLSFVCVSTHNNVKTIFALQEVLLEWKDMGGLCVCMWICLKFGVGGLFLDIGGKKGASRKLAYYGFRINGFFYLQSWVLENRTFLLVFHGPEPRSPIPVWNRLIIRVRGGGEFYEKRPPSHLSNFFFFLSSHCPAPFFFFGKGDGWVCGKRFRGFLWECEGRERES